MNAHTNITPLLDNHTSKNNVTKPKTEMTNKATKPINTWVTYEIHQYTHTSIIAKYSNTSVLHNGQDSERGETAMSNRTQIESLFTTDEQVIKGLDSPFLVQKENATIPDDLTPPEKNKVIVRMEELMNEALALVKNPAARNTTEEVAKTWMHREVRRYINFIAKYKNGVDSLGLIYGTYEVPELVQVAKGIVESLGTNSSGGHEANSTMQSLTAGVGVMAQNGGTGMMDSITIGLSKGWGWTWNFIKGTFSYLVGGTVKLVKTIISIIGFTFAQLVSFLDAATTKDFGRSGNPGIISSAMNY